MLGVRIGMMVVIMPVIMCMRMMLTVIMVVMMMVPLFAYLQLVVIAAEEAMLTDEFGRKAKKRSIAFWSGVIPVIISRNLTSLF